MLIYRLITNEIQKQLTNRTPSEMMALVLLLLLLGYDIENMSLRRHAKAN